MTEARVPYPPAAPRGSFRSLGANARERPIAGRTAVQGRDLVHGFDSSKHTLSRRKSFAATDRITASICEYC
jgi:hypothetical protein